MICLRAVFTLQCYDGEVVVQGFAFYVTLACSIGSHQSAQWPQQPPVARAFFSRRTCFFSWKFRNFRWLREKRRARITAIIMTGACESAKFHRHTMGLSDRCESIYYFHSPDGRLMSSSFLRETTTTEDEISKTNITMTTVKTNCATIFQKSTVKIRIAAIQSADENINFIRKFSRSMNVEAIRD